MRPCLTGARVDEAVGGGALVALGGARLPGGYAAYAAYAAILIAGAAVLILWTSDAPLPSAGKSAASYFPAKRVGLINIAYNLPLVVGPLTAGVVLSSMSSHPTLLAVAGVATLAAAATGTRVRLRA
jgi:hypothetical protein